uniref:Uncharacterized protein n=1 Tax=Anguilla anguilla TaxID=7936 RepID=A0A0E9QQA8_ANGAN
MKGFMWDTTMVHSPRFLHSVNDPERDMEDGRLVRIGLLLSECTP